MARLLVILLLLACLAGGAALIVARPGRDSAPMGDDSPSPPVLPDSSPAATPQPTPAVVPPLTADQLALMQQGEAFYAVACLACHQVHGHGQPGMAPSLINTPWVLGSEQRLIRIVLQGLTGPVTVHDEQWNLIMPGHAANPVLTDERIAGILTYIRRTWGNEASAVNPATVTQVRQATAGREQPWTVEELLRIDSD